MLSYLVKKIKKEDFKFDNHIPKIRLVQIVVSKAISLFNGLIILRRFAFIDPSAVLLSKEMIFSAGNFLIGKRCTIDALSIEGLKLGYNVSIHDNTSIECSGSLKNLGKGIIIGNNVGIGRNSHLGGAGGITIGDDTILGQYVSIHSENHNVGIQGGKIRLSGVSRKGVVIGSNCWIGAKATILDGVRLGDNCIVAAGAVLLNGVYEDNSVYGGIPAKKIGKTYK
jgi:acetyltransferase-like isoleucine patch superfamily enzyme